MIKQLKANLAPTGFYFTGRFADWEYYNMDLAMGAAMDLCNSILLFYDTYNNKVNECSTAIVENSKRMG